MEVQGRVSKEQADERALPTAGKMLAPNICPTPRTWYTLPSLRPSAELSW